MVGSSEDCQCLSCVVGQCSIPTPILPIPTPEPGCFTQEDDAKAYKSLHETRVRNLGTIATCLHVSLTDYESEKHELQKAPLHVGYCAVWCGVLAL